MSATNPFRLDGRIAFITGSSGGIGFALARALGQAGATLVLNGRDPARLESARAVLAGEGLTVHAQSFDVCDGAAAEAGVAAIESRVGAIDILVNNAGITRRGAFHELSAEDWQAAAASSAQPTCHVRAWTTPPVSPRFARPARS